MDRHSIAYFSTRETQPPFAQPAPDVSEGRLEVNVIFTNPRATAEALKCAESLARDLGAVIRLRAGIVVPFQLPLETPPVSVAFTERLLSELVARLDTDGFERTVDLYVCRDWQETLLQILNPDAPVVIGSSRRWWPTAENRLVKMLRSKGHRVIVAEHNRDPQPALSDARRASSFR
jgi:hypothetical protein